MHRNAQKRLVLLLKIASAALIISYLVWSNWYMVLHVLQFLSNGKYRSCVHRRRNYDLEEQSLPLYVTKRRHGRIGNWLFGYASLLGIAKANGYIPYLLESHPLASYFKLTKVRKEPVECLFTVHDELPCTYTQSMMNLPAGNVSIDGYIQSWKYFRFIEADLRRELRMHPSLAHDARQLFKEHVGAYIKEGRTVISIHVRRGDVLRPEARKLGFCHAPVQYFDNAMHYMLKKFPYSVFLVTSDDMGWCMANLQPPILINVFDDGGLSEMKSKHPKLNEDVLYQRVPIIFSKATSAWEDFSLLSQANHSIMSVGTFGWWGAWFAGGHTVYYGGFPLPGTKVDYETIKEDFFPPSWVALSSAHSEQFRSYRYLCMLIFCFILSKFFLLSQ